MADHETTPICLSFNNNALKIASQSTWECTVNKTCRCECTGEEDCRTIGVAVVSSPHDAARQHGTEAPVAPAPLGVHSLRSYIVSCHASCWLADLVFHPLRSRKCKLNSSWICWVPKGCCSWDWASMC